MMGRGNCAPPTLLQDHGDEEEDEDRADDEVTRQMIGTDADRKDGNTKIAWPIVTNCSKKI